ncbi:ABC transporter ATP-binding protein [Paenibacillus methanolicus]|uniref:Nickel import system ATP-binding protein NikD n=1 Tax=Paenibacillus methanolicus TaxID=582686 RepID=A0A5S5CCZ9_9BACL|nr:ABC transporter ATP-binding protein [Paenibacillus methanolicus]TYP76518.1 peptide/nickel transport system ATP-binding protein [Paenibacillus methanolicus]
MPLLEVKELSVTFTQYDRGLRRKKATAIQDLSLSVERGEIVAVVGASGSGKSLLAHAILGILPRNASVGGQMAFDGQPLTASRIRQLRGKRIAFVPQSVQSLDPLMRVGRQVRQAVRAGDPAEEQRMAFARYGLAPLTERRYPFQLSGGMARRVLVSIATVSGAELIVADEPTPGMDPAVVQETLRAFKTFAENGTAIVFITHDLEAALAIADKVAVFHAGTSLEVARAADFEGAGDRLRHPYSRALWRALPQNGFAVPDLGANEPLSRSAVGCSHARGCALATIECAKTAPKPRELRDGMVRCYHAT